MSTENFSDHGCVEDHFAPSALSLNWSPLGRWPRAGSPAEHLGWGARLLHFAPLALRPDFDKDLLSLSIQTCMPGTCGLSLLKRKCLTRENSSNLAEQL